MLQAKYTRLPKIPADVTHFVIDSIAHFEAKLYSCVYRRAIVISCFVQAKNGLSNGKKPFKRVTYYQDFPSGGLLVDYIYMVTKQLLCSLDQFLCCASMHGTFNDTMMSRHPVIRRVKVNIEIPKCIKI